MNRTLFGLAALMIGFGAFALVGCAKKKEDKEKADKEVAARLAVRDQLLASHHDKCVELFVKTEGFGGGRMIRLSHPSPAYPKSLDLPSEPELDDAGEPLPARPVTWVMDKVELVSLLNQETPGVYPANGVMMFASKRPKTRDLDTFESMSLAALRAGEATRVQDSHGELRVLGAIRAKAECMGCHSKYKAGDLLGAFTYLYKSTVPTP